MACVWAGTGTWLCPKGIGAVRTTRDPSASASMSFVAGSSRTRTSVFLGTSAANAPTRSAALLHSSFVTPSSSLSLSSSFSFSISGLSLGLDLKSNAGVGTERGHGLVVRAGKAALCQTKRNRSRKSLARTHGFRVRMSTTSGRKLLKRRRDKGRWVLCPKSYPNSGKFA